VHILYLIPSLDGSGGAEQAVAALAAPLVARGVELEVVTFGGATRGDDLTSQVEAAGAAVSTLAPPRRGGVWAPLERAAAFRSMVAGRRPDLVHTTLFDADLAGRVGGRIGGAPVVSSLVNVAYGPEQFANPAIRAWKLRGVHAADRLTAKGVRRFHALSPYVAQVMGPRLGVAAHRIDVIPRGRDASRLGAPDASRRVRVRAGLGVGPDIPLVVAAARQEYQKGLDVLLRAWPRVRAGRPEARLLLGGRRGSQTASLEALSAAAGPASGIEWLGPRDDVPDLLVAADVFVVPSRWEGFGSVLVEAMALGATVVASDVGPIPEVVGTGWARLVAPDDPDALAAAVLTSLDQSSAERAERARLARRRFVESFSLDVVADATVAFYRRALGEPGGG
jgi:glycosyltransferase involved in cell wall biosynthesis